MSPGSRRCDRYKDPGETKTAEGQGNQEGKESPVKGASGTGSQQHGRGQGGEPDPRARFPVWCLDQSSTSPGTITWEPALQTPGFWAQPQACLIRNSELGTSPDDSVSTCPSDDDEELHFTTCWFCLSGEPESLGELLELATPRPHLTKTQCDSRRRWPRRTYASACMYFKSSRGDWVGLNMVLKVRKII